MHFSHPIRNIQLFSLFLIIFLYHSTSFVDLILLKFKISFQFNVQRLQDAHTLSSQAAAASSPASSAATAASVGAGGVLGDAHPLAAHHHHPLYLQGSAHSSGGSVSSTGGGSPTSPLRPGKEEECSLHGRSSTEGKNKNNHSITL